MYLIKVKMFPAVKRSYNGFGIVSFKLGQTYNCTSLRNSLTSSTADSRDWKPVIMASIAFVCLFL